MLIKSRLVADATQLDPSQALTKRMDLLWIQRLRLRPAVGGNPIHRCVNDMAAVLKVDPDMPDPFDSVPF